MARLAVITIAITASAFLLQAEMQLTLLRPGASNSVELFVDKTGALSGKRHRFVFQRYEGRLMFDEANPSRSAVTFRIESASIVCKDTWVSAKDLSKIEETAKSEMLAADRFPSVVFTSTSIEPAGERQFRVSGNLTIRDRAKAVIVDVERIRDGYEGRAAIRMIDFGLKPPSAALGLVGTKNEMALVFRLAAKSE